MKLELNPKGSRQDVINKLQDEIDKLEEIETKEQEKKEKEIRAKVPFTDEQLQDVADSLSSKDVYFYFDEDSEDQEYEDDGFIHVTRYGIRFAKEGSESQLQSFARNVEKQMKKLVAKSNQ